MKRESRKFTNTTRTHLDVGCQMQHIVLMVCESAFRNSIATLQLLQTFQTYRIPFILFVVRIDRG